MGYPGPGSKQFNTECGPSSVDIINSAVGGSTTSWLSAENDSDNDHARSRARNIRISRSKCERYNNFTLRYGGDSGVK